MPLLGFLVLLTGLWDLKDILISRQNRSSKNILVSENAVKRVHGSCLLRVMDSDPDKDGCPAGPNGEWGLPGSLTWTYCLGF